MTWDRFIEILILLAVLGDIAVWYFSARKREQKYLELQERVVELLEDSNAELAEIADVTAEGNPETGQNKNEQQS